MIEAMGESVIVDGRVPVFVVDAVFLEIETPPRSVVSGDIYILMSSKMGLEKQTK